MSSALHSESIERSNFRVELEALLPLMLEAGILLREGRATVSQVRRKPDRSLVTELDHRSALFLDRHLDTLFPGDGVLNEETHMARNSPWRRAARCWLVDPLDSTSSFVGGGSHYGVILGLTVDGKPRLGMAHRPETGEVFWAAQGEGAWEAKALGNRIPRHWSRLRVASDPAPRLLVSRGRRNLALASLMSRLGDPPATGLDGSLKICEVARGPFTAFVAPAGNPLSLWDLCGPQVVLEEAGGVLSGLDGAPIDYRAASTTVDQGILAATPAARAWILDRLGISPAPK